MALPFVCRTMPIGCRKDVIPVRDEVRLDLGVAFDGISILDDVLVAADVFEAQDLVKALHNFAHFAQLVLVIGGKYYLFHKLQSIGSMPCCIR